MKDHPVAAATGSPVSSWRASRSDSARLAPRRSRWCRASISGTTAASLTGRTLAMIPTVPSGTRLAVRPSSSSAPAGAEIPESQLERTRRYGARRSRSRSWTVSGPSSRRSEENSGLSARNLPWAAMWASQAPSMAPSTRCAVAVPRPSTVTSSYSSQRWHLGAAGAQVGTPDEDHAATRGWHCPARAEPDVRRGRHAEHAVTQRRQQRPGDRVEPARWDDHDRAAAEVTAGLPEEHLLESPSARLQLGGRRLRAAHRTVVGQAPQPEARELQLPSGLGRAARREAPHLPAPADQCVQVAVDLDDLDQARGADLLQQGLDLQLVPVAAGAAGAAGAHGAGADVAFQTLPLVLEGGRRRALSAGVLEAAHDLAQGRQVALELVVVRRPDRRDRQGRRPPSFAPGEQAPWPPSLEGMPLRQGRQLGAVRGGLSPQLRRAQGVPVLVEQVEPLPAGVEHLAPPGDRLGPQCLGQPAAGPVQDGATAPRSRGDGEMTVGVLEPCQRQRRPPGDQMRRGGLAG